MTGSEPTGMLALQTIAMPADTNSGGDTTMQLHARAVRQLMRYLVPGRGDGAALRLMLGRIHCDEHRHPYLGFLNRSRISGNGNAPIFPA